MVVKAGSLGFLQKQQTIQYSLFLLIKGQNSILVIKVQKFLLGSTKLPSLPEVKRLHNKGKSRFHYGENILHGLSKLFVLSYSAKKGFVRFSFPIVVSGPCPGKTIVSSGSTNNFCLILVNNC